MPKAAYPIEATRSYVHSAAAKQDARMWASETLLNESMSALQERARELESEYGVDRIATQVWLASILQEAARAQLAFLCSDALANGLPRHLLIEMQGLASASNLKSQYPQLEQIAQTLQDAEAGAPDSEQHVRIGGFMFAVLTTGHHEASA